MDHLNARIPRFTFNSGTTHTFEKWYSRYSPILESEGSALSETDKTRFIVSKLNTSEYDAFVNYIRPAKISDLKPDESIGEPI